MTRAVAVCLVLACACPALAHQARPQVPLRKIVADEGCQAATLPAAVSSALVVSFAVLHDGQDCVIAFVRDLEREGAPLEIISSSTPSHNWNYATVPVTDNELSPIASVRLENDLILVNLLYTIDDFAIPILNGSLKHLGTIHGTFVRTWPNGLLQYDSHQPHFGPHDVEIGVFDPKTGANREIYPFTPCGAVRSDYVRRYYEAIGQSLAITGDPPCRSEAAIMQPMYFDWNTNAFAFAIDLFVQYGEFPKWDERAHVMVTCEGLASIDSIKCRETPLEAWQTAMPDLSLVQLVRFAASQPRFR